MSLKQHNCMKQWNNKGFSLVELLVSIAMLAIIVIPVFSNIVLASRTNYRSREMQQVVDLGDDIMEGLKAEASIEDIAKQFVYNSSYNVKFDIASSQTVSSEQTCELKKEGSTFTKATQNSISYNAANDTFEFQAKDKSVGEGRVYYFGIKDLKIGQNKYDAVITCDAEQYSKNEEDESEEAKINDVEIPIISSIATDKNAVISQGYSDNYAITTLTQRYNEWFNSTYTPGSGVTNTVTNKEIEQDMRRTFKINIDYNATSKKYIVTAGIQYKLKSLIPESETDYNTYSVDHLFYDQFDSLENVYLFYSPKLSSREETGLKPFQDDVVINNNLEKLQKNHLGIYIVEQEFSGTEAEKASYEAAYDANMSKYKLQISYKDTTSGTFTTEEEKTQPVTQLVINVGEKSGVPVESIVDTAIVSSYKVTKSFDLIKEAAKDRIYNMKVELYESSKEHYNKGKLVLTLDSTKEE